MTPTLANGHPAAAAYYRDDGTHHALGVAVLTATSAGVAPASSSSLAAPAWWPDSAFPLPNRNAGNDHAHGDIGENAYAAGKTGIG